MRLYLENPKIKRENKRDYLEVNVLSFLKVSIVANLILLGIYYVLAIIIILLFSFI